MVIESASAYTLDRRRFFKAAAGTAAAASATGALAWPPRSGAHDRDDDDLTSPPPKPIPGGIQIPGGPQIHVWVPGDPSVTLPLSGMACRASTSIPAR